MADNEIKQKITLDTKSYSDNIKKANKDLKSSLDDMNKDLTNSSKTVNQNETEWKQWGKSITDTVKKAGDNFKNNLSTGIKAATLGFGATAIKSAAKDAVDMAMDASETFAKIQSRLGATSAQMDKWRDSIGKTAVNTKTNLSQMTEAFDEMSQVANPDEVLKFMDAIGNATMMNGENSKGVTDLLKTTIRGQGKEFNAANVNDVLNSANLLMNHGTDMGSMDKAMGAMAGLDQNAVRMSGLSQRQIAGLMSGASATGEHGIDAVSALFGQNAQGVLGQLNGVLGGKLMDQSGKVNLSALGSAQAMKMTHEGKDENTSLAIFKQISGLGDKEAEGMFKLIRQYDKMSTVMDQTINDQTTLGDTAKIAGNNLKANYQKLETTLVTGFTDIFKGFEQPLNDLSSGNFMKGAGGMMGAIKQAGIGIMDHPLLAAGTIGTLAGGGALLSGLLGKIPGMGNVAGAAIAKKAGVEPVYVVNANEISSGMGGMLGKAGGFLGKAGAVGLAGGAGYALGSEVINPLLDSYTSKTNKYGQESNIVERGIAKLLPEWAGGMTSAQYKDTYENQQVEVVIKMEADGFSARPTAKNAVRDAGAY